MDKESAGPTTTGSPAIELANFLGGFVAAEGCFTRGKPDREFRFAVGLGATDAGMCERFRSFLGCGYIVTHPRRKAHYDDEVCFNVARTEDLVTKVIPFMDAHLLPSYKRSQYEAWRADVLHYWDDVMRRTRACSVEVCVEPQRAKGLCRRHYYEIYGR